ncbi:methyl-accepting chemotaxis protein [Halarsenatibacter silvermanii]|uniref:Methyl-accepting chemotaxis protein n=1 Tax=Halarsenatibacter silvermanii TaxID=321763 RepID=A0A1G9IZP4_9FIRM|nr:methyl-accepting chemotaxis protein [Halarsenatibacter silvermanii]SDL30727.1 Methyl-accepting chemotaxis protein [Halarsenatibacter silvermanii]
MLKAVLLILALLLLISIYRLFRLRKAFRKNAVKLKENMLGDYDFIDEMLDLVERFSASILETKKAAATNRKVVNNMLEKHLRENPGIFGAWVVFEPDKFDGADNSYSQVDHYDETGRFNSYFYRAGGQISVMSLPEIDKEEFYNRPREEKSTVVMDPFIYDELENGEVLMTAIAEPIIEDDEVLGVTGVDIMLQEGTTHLDKELIFKSASDFSPLDFMDRVVTASISSFGEMIHMLGDSADELDRTSRKLSEAYSEVEEAGDEIARAAEDMASDAEEQSSSIQGALKSVDDLKDFTEDNQETVRSVIDVNQQIVGFREDNSEKINELREDSRQNNEAIESLIDQIGSVEEQTSAISDINTQIQEVAEQINLLALNASIEAARAGERGEGFGVVAEEVRELSVETDKFAQDISETIDSLIGEINRVRKEAGRLADASQKQLASTEDVFVAFENLQDLLKEQEKNIEVFGENFSELHRRQEKLTENIEGVSASSQEFAANTEEITASMEEQAGSISRLKDTTEDIVSQARVLESRLARFEDQLKEK